MKENVRIEVFFILKWNYCTEKINRGMDNKIKG